MKSTIHKQALAAFTTTCFLTVGSVRADAAEDSAKPAPAEKPNIIVILSDDAGYADFSMQGSNKFLTPHIDSIAANGVRFTNGYVSAPVCSPSRAGLMTGRYQQRFGHEMNILTDSPAMGLPVTEMTFADAMKSAGYRTIALGKWHLGSAPQFQPLKRGFDDFYGFLGGARSYFPGADGTKKLHSGSNPVKESFNYMTDTLSQQAAAHIRENKSRPFFMYLAFNAVHTPFDALNEDLKQVRGISNSSRKKLCAMTLALDRAVGVVLGELKQQGLTDNTLVFFINDNGGAPYGNAYNNAPLHGFKGSTWEGGIRIPFAVQWPGRIPKGRIYHHPVITLDMMPTAMACAGVTQAPANPLDGVNLLPFLTGKNQAAPHEALFWRFGTSSAVRMGDWKLAVVKGDDARLFNLATDIGEKNDLAGKQPDKLQELKTAYAKWNAANIPPKWMSREGPPNINPKARKKGKHPGS